MVWLLLVAEGNAFFNCNLVRVDDVTVTSVTDSPAGRVGGVHFIRNSARPAAPAVITRAALPVAGDRGR
jgi:hypothetical protein